MPDGDARAGSQQKTQRQVRAVDSRQRRVLDALESGPATADRLVELTGLPVREVGVALGELEAVGKLVRGGPGLYLLAQMEP